MRKVKQNKTKGDIYLHSMPGRYETMSSMLTELRAHSIDVIVSLTSEAEIMKKSPDFAQALKEKSINGLTHLLNPVEDFGIPVTDQNLTVYRKTILQAATLLETKNILVHCGAGIGRTGTFAVILLRALGFDYETSYALVQDAGSKPEADNQIEFARDFVII